jgi:hypothetical protein
VPQADEPVAYASIRQHTSAYVSIRLHTSAYASIRQHTSEDEPVAFLDAFDYLCNRHLEEASKAACMEGLFTRRMRTFEHLVRLFAHLLADKAAHLPYQAAVAYPVVHLLHASLSVPT